MIAHSTVAGGFSSQVYVKEAGKREVNVGRTWIESGMERRS